MAILSTLKSAANKVVSAAKSVVSAAKSTFLPSEKVAAERRTAVFGSESKAKAGAIIVGSAAAAIAAPAVITSGVIGKTASAVASKVATSFAQSSLKTQAAVVGGGLIATGAVLRQPKETAKAVSKAPGALLNFGGNLADFAVDPSVKNAQSIWLENPLISTATIGLTAAAVGGAVTSAVSGALTQSAIREQTEATLEVVDTLKNQYIPSALAYDVTELPPSVLTGDDKTSLVPITPETQVIGKAAKSAATKKRRRLTSQPRGSTQRQSLRLNIYNQGKHLYTGRTYLS